MMETEIFQQVAIAVTTALAGYLIKLARTFLLKKIDNEEIRAVVDEISEAAHVAVSETNQRQVSKLRPQPGVWTSTTKERLAASAVNKVKHSVGKKRLEVLKAAAGLNPLEVDAKVRGYIEAEVRRQKKNG